MKRLSILAAMLLLSCAAGPKYHFGEGPPRIQISAPRVLNTGQIFLLKVTLQGEIAQIPFGEIVGIEVQANDITVTRSAFMLTSRYMAVQMQLSPAFYTMFRGPRRGPMDYEEYDPPGMLPPIEGAQDEDLDLPVTLKVVLTQIEIDYKNELAPLKQIAKADWNLRLTCVQRECISMY